jgi:folylpolyglutamate synthase
MPWVKSIPPTELALSIQDLVSAESVPIWTPSQDVSLAEGEKNVSLEAALNWAANLDKHRWEDRGEEEESEVQQLVVVAGSLYLVADFYRLLDSFDPKSP